MAATADNFQLHKRLDENSKMKKTFDSDSDREVWSTRKPASVKKTTTPIPRKLKRDMDAELITMSTGVTIGRAKKKKLLRMW